MFNLEMHLEHLGDSSVRGGHEWWRLYVDGIGVLVELVLSKNIIFYLSQFFGIGHSASFVLVCIKIIIF